MMSEEVMVVSESGLPVFKGESWEDHVSQWIQCEEMTWEERWKQAAIAASVTAKWGERMDTMRAFAAEVGMSPVTIRRYAQTHRVFQIYPRGQILSFSHHYKAASASDPGGLIAKAELEGLSAHAVQVLEPLEPQEQDYLIKRSREEKWKMQRLADEARELKTLGPDAKIAPEEGGDDVVVDEGFRELCPVCEGNGFVKRTKRLTKIRQFLQTLTPSGRIRR